MSQPQTAPAELPDVELQEVVKVYDNGFVAVKRCSLTIEKGEFVTLLGPSGCGKTTTLNMIAGFFAPSEGRIRIRGRDVTRLPPNRRQVGMVFQNYALFPHLTVAQNVGFGLRMRGAAQAEIARAVGSALEKVHMSQFADRYPRQLSGGQQQRVALARAIAPEPSVLLLDEPLSNLDLKLRERMRSELKALQRELGITSVFVTHDQDEALTMSDRIVVMEGGEVCQIGAPAEIYSRPASRFVASFVGQMNFLSGRAAGDRFTLDGAGGELPLAALSADHHTIGIRPEVIRILPEEAPEPEGTAPLAGLIREVTLAGPMLQIGVGIGSQELRVDVMNRGGRTDWRPGQRVRLAVQPGDIIGFGG